MGKLIIGLIRVYKALISPLLPPSCRFHPSCSEYAAQAIRSHGSVAGLALGLVRLLKCHPWHPGGFDPVPAKDTRPLRSAL